MAGKTPARQGRPRQLQVASRGEGAGHSNRASLPPSRYTRRLGSRFSAVCAASSRPARRAWFKCQLTRRSKYRQRSLGSVIQCDPSAAHGGASNLADSAEVVVANSSSFELKPVCRATCWASFNWPDAKPRPTVSFRSSERRGSRRRAFIAYRLSTTLRIAVLPPSTARKALRIASGSSAGFSTFWPGRPKGLPSSA